MFSFCIPLCSPASLCESCKVFNDLIFFTSEIKNTLRLDRVRGTAKTELTIQEMPGFTAGASCDA